MRAFNNDYDSEIEYYDKEPDIHGRVWMQTLDYGDAPGILKKLNLSKKRLGDFCYWALKYDAEIGSLYCLNSGFERAWVGASIRIRPDRIADFENNSGIGLRIPPKIKLS